MAIFDVPENETLPYHDVVIVGGGHAGAQVAISLRQQGFAGTIAMVGSELQLPYDRPALSKEYLLGRKTFERMLLRPRAFWEERQIVLLLGRTVTTVEAHGRVITANDGYRTRYGHLVWAAGGRPRRLGCEGSELGGVHVIRSKADIDRILGELGGVSNVVIVGGGYIGLEVAAALTALGKRITLVEALDRVLARVAGAELSRFYEDVHRANGVDVRLNAGVSSLHGDGRSVAGVRLSNGEILPAELVIVGIGIIPDVAPLSAAGAEAGDGVMVDSIGRTSIPGVYAVGDCASHHNRFAGGRAVRVESVQNANDMATAVAKSIAGKAEPYDAVPWFWSNQYDLKLQTVGLSSGYDQTVMRGSPAMRSFSIIYLRDGHVIALDCVNAARDYVQGRALVVDRVAVDPELLADVAIPLKSHHL